MNILDTSKVDEQEVIQAAVETLKSGGLLIYPTETCYGVGVDATNQDAVDKVLQYKNRREGKPLSIAVSSLEMAEQYAEVNDEAKSLFDRFLPGPLTVISTSKNKTAQGVGSELGTIGLRFPAYPLITDIIDKLGKPITATTAVEWYQKTPYSVDDILSTISQKKQDIIGLIIDAGELPHNPPSTIVDTTLNDLQMLRRGGLVFDDSRSKKYTSRSEEDTMQLAAEILDAHHSTLATHTLIFALEGELGAGKTHFTKGLARYLGVTDNVVSPTFTLAREYEYNSSWGSGMLLHVDTWKLFSEEELEDIGINSYMNAGTIIVIEWPEKIPTFLEHIQQDPNVMFIKVHLDHVDGHTRQIRYE